MDKLDPFAHPPRLPVDPCLGKFGEKSILFDGVDFARTQTSHFDGKESKAGTAFNTHGVTDEATVAAEKPPVGSCALVVVVDRNESEEVVNRAETVRRKAIQNIHPENLRLETKLLSKFITSPTSPNAFQDSVLRGLVFSWQRFSLMPRGYLERSVGFSVAVQQVLVGRC